jgi:Asp-tRNA(Asn)/Glu-tRNA(Gln) amidotransferase A subunit family amidase
LARIQQTNPRLNALVVVLPDEALDMANTTDWAVALCSKEDNLWT